MYKLIGKYNVANIMLPENYYLDETTTSQIYTFLNHPAFEGEAVYIMPDAHAGKGAVIGFTMKMNDNVFPNIVGVDIGCGISMVELNVDKIDFQKFDDYVRKNIPSGHSIHTKSSKFIHKYINLDSFKLLSEKVEQKVDVINSIGTLGGGNHFIEIGKNEKEEFFLVVHSGSRNLGLCVANYHNKKAKNLMKEIYGGDAFKDLAYLPLDKGGQEYINDMFIAQNYARINRNIILLNLLNFFGDSNYGIKSCIHNYINPKDNIVRKGAISAYEHEDVIIPLNMRDGIIIGKGKSNADWNYSAPHGAGRVLSRKKAKENLSLDKVKEDMKDIWTSSLSEKTLDEAPDAYKDSSLIIEAIKETVEIEDIIKPVYNFKA